MILIKIISDSKQKVYTGSDTVYSYTVNFDEKRKKKIQKIK